jgi:hypothetical protein
MPRYDHDDAAVNHDYDDYDHDDDDAAADDAAVDDAAVDDDHGVRCGLLPSTAADEIDSRLPAAVGTGDEVVDVAT